jgi:hypothetical protein
MLRHLSRQRADFRAASPGGAAPTRSSRAAAKTVQVGPAVVIVKGAAGDGSTTPATERDAVARDDVCDCDAPLEGFHVDAVLLVSAARAEVNITGALGGANQVGRERIKRAATVGAPGAKHIATGFYNLVISTNRCERNHGYVKSRIRPMRGLKSFHGAMRLFPALDALQLIERDFVRVPPLGAPCTGGRSYVRARHIAAVVTRLGRTL